MKLAGAAIAALFLGATPVSKAYLGGDLVWSAAPATPTGLATVRHNGEVDLAWDAVSGATTYKVYRATSEAGTYTEIGEVATAYATDAAATNGTVYWYKVSAVNAGGESAQSAAVSALAWFNILDTFSRANTSGTAAGRLGNTETGRFPWTIHTGGLPNTIQITSGELNGGQDASTTTAAVKFELPAGYPRFGKFAVQERVNSAAVLPEHTRLFMMHDTVNNMIWLSRGDDNSANNNRIRVQKLTAGVLSDMIASQTGGAPSTTERELSIQALASGALTVRLGASSWTASGQSYPGSGNDLWVQNQRLKYFNSVAFTPEENL